MSRKAAGYILILTGVTAVVILLPSVSVANIEDLVSRYARLYRIPEYSIRSVFRRLGIGTLSEKYADFKVKMHSSIHRKYGAHYGVDPALSMAIEWVESKGNTNALRYERSIGDVSVGLMQVTTKTAREVCGYSRIEDLKNPDVNIRCGIAYLAKLKKSYSRLDNIISAYNAGRPIKGNVVNYVIPVLKKYSDYKAYA